MIGEVETYNFLTECLKKTQKSSTSPKNKRSRPNCLKVEIQYP